MTRDELIEDLQLGSQNIVELGRIDPLNKEDLKHLIDIFKCPFRLLSIEPGKQDKITALPIEVFNT